MITEYKSDRTSVQTELDAVLEYEAKINEMCVAKAEPYAERKARREAEISGLKEALEILEGEAVLLQGSRFSKKRSRRRESESDCPGSCTVTWVLSATSNWAEFRIDGVQTDMSSPESGSFNSEKLGILWTISSLFGEASGKICGVFQPVLSSVSHRICSV